MIRTRGLSYTYATGGAAPLRFPDVDLRQGGTLLLRGRSGTGKSTWLALMAGLRGASGGDLFVAGTQLGTQRGADGPASQPGRHSGGPQAHAGRQPHTHRHSQRQQHGCLQPADQHHRPERQRQQGLVGPQGREQRPHHGHHAGHAQQPQHTAESPFRGLPRGIRRTHPYSVVHGHGFTRVQARISASISSAFTGTPRVMSSQPASVTMASSSMRMPMWWNCSGTPSAGRT